MLRFLKRKVILFFFLNKKIIHLLEKIQKLQINKKKIKATDKFHHPESNDINILIYILFYVLIYIYICI